MLDDPIHYTTTMRANQIKRERQELHLRIRQARFHRTDRDILIALVNHWIGVRHIDRGIMHPGREKIANKAQCSVKSVSRMFKRLREAGVLTPVMYLKGGYNATRYRFSADIFEVFCNTNKREFVRNRKMKTGTW